MHMMCQLPPGLSLHVDIDAISRSIYDGYPIGRRLAKTARLLLDRLTALVESSNALADIRPTDRGVRHRAAAAVRFGVLRRLRVIEPSAQVK
jgi:hypothetical protein